MTRTLATPRLTRKSTTDTPPIAQPDTTRSRRIYNSVQKDAVTFVQTAEETSGVCSLFD